MPETVKQIIPTGSWLDLSAIIGANARIDNSGNSVLIYVYAPSKPSDDSTDGHRVNEDKTFDYVVEGADKIWITSLRSEGIVSATPSLAVGSFMGAMNIHSLEVHNRVVNELFHLHTGISSDLAVASDVGDISLQLDSVVGFNIGNHIQISDGVVETTFPEITGLPGGNVLTLDRPLDFAYAVDDDIEVVTTDLQTTVGSLASPIIYQLKPEAGVIWYIHRILLSMTHPTAATDDKFGDQTALSNGVVLRSNIDGQFRSFTNWKRNGDIMLDMFDVNYSDKAGASLFGTSGRGSFSRVGMLVKLDGDVGDFMDILIQDDLTGLSSFFINGQGYTEPSNA